MENKSNKNNNNNNNNNNNSNNTSKNRNKKDIKMSVLKSPININNDVEMKISKLKTTSFLEDP